jgi:hypothetical protein
MLLRLCIRLVIGAATACLAANTALAHGIWFAQRSTQTALIFGVGADDLDMVRRQPLVTRIDGYDEELQPVPAELRENGPLLLLDNFHYVSLEWKFDDATTFQFGKLRRHPLTREDGTSSNNILTIERSLVAARYPMDNLGGVYVEHERVASTHWLAIAAMTTRPDTRG